LSVCAAPSARQSGESASRTCSRWNRGCSVLPYSSSTHDHPIAAIGGESNDYLPFAACMHAMRTIGRVCAFVRHLLWSHLQSLPPNTAAFSGVPAYAFSQDSTHLSTSLEHPAMASIAGQIIPMRIRDMADTSPLPVDVRATLRRHRSYTIRANRKATTAHSRLFPRISATKTGLMPPSIERPVTGGSRRDGEEPTRWQRCVGKRQILPPI